MSDIVATQDSQLATEAHPFVFVKENGGLFVLYLKTMFLSVVTLGIYYFWGRVAITKFIYNNTSFGGRPFDYHATGKEMFLGFLKGVGILIGLYGVYMLLGMVINKLVMFIILYLALGLFGVPFLIIGKWRFMLSRSSWCSVRFAHDGKYSPLLKIWVKGGLLTLATLGFYWFVLENKIQKYIMERSRFGTLPFSYDGDNKEFFWLNVKGFLLTVCTLGIYGAWYIAKVNNYLMSHTCLNNHRMNATMTGKSLFVLSITNFFIVIFTLGFGFPIAVNRMYSYFFEHLTIQANPDDLATMAGTMDTGASALASGIEEASNVVDALSGIV